MTFRVLDLGADPADVTGFGGRNYYRLATITWSRPKVWHPSERVFDVPAGWSGFGGVYVFTRRHWNQVDQTPEIAYVGKAIDFQKRLTNKHNHFDIVERQGETKVSCGRVAFDRIKKSKPYLYLEIEELVKFSLHWKLENVQGFESLPGFRSTQARSMVPWVVTNEGYRFKGMMPKRIVYPAIGVEF